MVNFPTRIPECHCHNPALLDVFISSDPSICFTVGFRPSGNTDDVVVSVSIDFPSNSKGDAPFNGIPFDYSLCDWDMFHGRICLNLVLLLLLNFVRGSKLELIHIPHDKDHVKPHSSLWFSGACAAAIVHTNHFFGLY